MSWIIVFGILVCLLLLRMAAANRKNVQTAKTAMQEEYGKKPQPGIRRSAASCANYLTYHTPTDGIDEITWKDLDMERVFQRMNYTHCAAGAEKLYAMLHQPVFQEKELEAREQLIRELQEQKAVRNVLVWELSQLGFHGNAALEEYLGRLDKLEQRSKALPVLLDLLYLPGIIVLFFQPVAGLLVLFAAVLVNMLWYFREKALLRPHLTSFAYLLRLLRCADRLQAAEKVAADGGLLRERLSQVQSSRKGFTGFVRFSGVVMSMDHPSGSSNPVDLLFDYVRMLFHPDLMKFDQMLSTCRLHREDLILLNEQIGELDALCCVAYYRASLPLWCVPQRMAEGLSVEELCHPLLEHAVPNSLTARRGVLITGSNASGKSTFLKTLAINAILAQSIVTCTAKRFSGEAFRIYSSMALQDNLSGGESYYMVEIRALKRILDAAAGQGKPRVLCFVDEVLRGTNTIERIAASAQILHLLYRRGVLAFAATHDIELSSLLQEDADNYHFEEELRDGQILFSYQMKAGRATSRNAIRLLQEIGYDDSITGHAEKMAQNFLATGEWSMA